MARNLDPDTVKGFGQEWSTFDQSGIDASELQQIFAGYFSLFPWQDLKANAKGFDLGCGSGRWARFVAPRVGVLHCIDASREALSVAERNLDGLTNCHFTCASVDEIPLADGSMDFGYSLGVLHHLPDTAAGIRACAAKLKPGAPLLVYLYYALDNRSVFYRALWRASDLARRQISHWPRVAKLAICQAIAGLIYYPAARVALLLARAGVKVEGLPLAFYRHKSFQTMRTDAFDRFATRLEQRFSRDQIQAMMEAAGLVRIAFREAPPYWCAIGYRAS